MKKILLFLTSLFVVCTCFSEEIFINENEFNVNVISSDDVQTVIEYNFGNFERNPVEIDDETYYRLSLEKESETYEKGSPELPKITRSIIIPDDAKMKINVIEKDYVEYRMKIVPSKGILYRDIDPADVPYEFSETYRNNEFYPQNTAGSNSPYILRDFRGLTIHAYPFAYNPITQTLRVYHHLVLAVNNIGTDTENIKTRSSNNINKYFTEIYQNHFINFSRDRYTSVDEHGRMIVICYDSFMSNIQPYVDWKNQKGINTELHSFSSIGTTATDIMIFVQSEYDEGNDLAFVQLVGDAAQIPPYSSTYGDSDPYFALVDGGDGYPDLFVGRFSAETTSEVDTQVERTIHYERDISSGVWLKKAFGIGSAEGDGYGDDGEADYVHIGNIRTDLLGYTYDEVDEIYDPGASASQVSAAVNAGRSFGNYTGHGSDYDWSTTGFAVSHINALTNDNMLPFICDVACVNGNFNGLTCFAEAWLRATNGANPTGAIAIYASTINQSWAPPMSAQDEVTDLLCGTGPYSGSGNQKDSFGGLMYNGSCLMLDEYSANDMYQTWTIFGDASLQVRTDTPTTMTISHDANILVGQTTFDVSTGVEGALACLYDGTNIVGSGYTNASGNVTLTLDPAPSSPGNLTLSVTAYNKTTSVETIPVIAADGPYVVIDSYTVDSGGDDVIEPGETAFLTITLLNNGTETATNTSMTLSEADSYITLTDDYESYGSIAASGSVTRTNAYSFTVASDIPDEHPIHLDAAITCDEDSWNDDIDLTASNPADISVNPTQFDETLEPDETSSDNLNIGNTGGATLNYDAEIIETTRSPLLRDMIKGNFDYLDKDPSSKKPLGNIYEYTSRAYCSASGGCDEYISQVVVGDINNSSGCDGYADYTTISTDMTIGTGYAITVTNGNTWTGDECDVYVDWNQDEDFADTGEYFLLANGPDVFDGTITPPEGALTGETRMRIRIRYYGTQDPCGDFTYGEVEDYAVNVQTDGPEWVTLDGGSSVSGSITAGAGDDVIVVGFDATGLAEGVYTADIEITNNDPDESTITVPVTLTVDSGGIPEPDILVSPTSLSQELEPGQTDSQTFDITNNGDPGTTLTYNITWEYTTSRSFTLDSRPEDMSVAEYMRLYSNTRDETWLNVIPISGSCLYNETDNITTEFNSAGMTDGTYTATITIANNAGADEYVYVTLDVETPGGTTPVNPRAIAEFEPMEGVLVRYPFGVPVSLIAEMSEDVMITTILANSSEEATVTSTYSSNGVNMVNTNFEYSPTDTYWIRDYGPWWIEDGTDDVSISDYTYNRPRPDDNNIPGEMATFLSENLYLMGLEHSGGNYMTDGMGIAVSSDLVAEENSSLTQAQIDQIMEDYLGIQTYHVVDDPNGDYIKHVDCWAKFLDIDKILIREVPIGHSQYDEIEAVVDYFETQTSSYGTPYEIYRVDTSNDEPYINSLILNDKVLLPTMNTPTQDNAAISAYEAAMPGYEVLGFYDSDWVSTDAIHCRLRGIADREMVYIGHLHLSGTLAPADYEIDATIVAYSGQPLVAASLLVYYRVDGGSYTSVTMTSQGGNDYQGIIPEQVEGSVIDYYIYAEDVTGNSANHPFIGASDPHSFTVEGTPPASITVTSPNGGEDWQLDSTHNITWTSSNTSGDVKIELYDNGVFSNTISSSTTDDGSFSWFIDESVYSAGTQYTVKIEDVTDPATYDDSDADFTLSAIPEPDITYTPTSFEKDLLPDATTSDHLFIGNAGGATLDYTATVSYIERSELAYITNFVPLPEKQRKFDFIEKDPPIEYDPSDYPAPLRQGGEDVGSAVTISSLPFTDTGTTSGYLDDYDETCPYSGSTSPDVCYSYAPAADMSIDIDLCNSSYDTKVYVYENSVTPGSPFACDDDYYGSGDPCGSWVSALLDLSIYGGNTYYIIVDGYGGDSGDYEIEVTENITTGYCSASGGGDEYISGVQIGSIDNTGTGSDGYYDYTALSTDLTQEETGVAITITNGNVYSSDDLGIWIDWNQDEDFEDTDENVVCTVNDGAQGTYYFDVPADAVEGNTRMRIRIKYYGSDCGSSCGSTTYGEVEDYTINVLSSGPGYSWLTLDGGNEVSGTILSGGADDDITVGFDATGLSLGAYDANIVITSNDPDESTVNIPVTLNVTNELDPPANLVITSDGTDVTLAWDPVTGATSYTVYSDTDPYGIFATSEWTGADTNWSEPLAEDKKFYRVTASN